MSIRWEMMSMKEIEKLYEYAKKYGATNVVVMNRSDNGIGVVTKVALPIDFFSEVDRHKELTEWPDCAEDITDYSAW